MAPEMFAGLDAGLGAGDDARDGAGIASRGVAANRGTDVYALGTLLWEHFTGLAPWHELLHAPDPSASRLARV